MRVGTVDVNVRLKLGTFDMDVAFVGEPGITVLFGHSGSGKSLTLRTVTGLTSPDSGRISLDGRPLFDSTAGINLRPKDRPIGLVLQDSALFPHLSVLQNVTFGMPPDSGSSHTTKAVKLLDFMGMAGFESRKPGTLSGGQRQRVALARALARDARVLLLDEPFSALDDSLRVTLRKELLRLRAELGLTIIFVTHDLREAHLLADRLAVFDDGRILQFAPREEVFRRPASRRVAELTGTSNIFPATVLESTAEGMLLDLAGLRLHAGHHDVAFVRGAEVYASIRAERVNLRRGGEPRNAVRAVLREEFAFGSSHTLHFAPVGPGPELEVEIASRPYEVLGVAVGQEWLLELPPEDLHVMPRAATTP